MWKNCKNGACSRDVTEITLIRHLFLKMGLYILCRSGMSIGQEAGAPTGIEVEPSRKQLNFKSIYKFII